MFLSLFHFSSLQFVAIHISLIHGGETCLFLNWDLTVQDKNCNAIEFYDCGYLSQWFDYLYCRQLYTVRDGGTIALDWLLASDLEGSASLDSLRLISKQMDD